MQEVVLLGADDVAAPSPERLGREGWELLHMAQRLRTVPTLILTTDTFEQYRQTARLPDDVIDSVVAFASANHASEVTIRASTAQAMIGLPGSERVSIDRGRIKYVIERIFRSWSDDRPKSYRITHRIADADALPAVIIQVLKSSNVHALSTRNPRNGQVTDEQSYKVNASNHVEFFRDDYVAMIHAVEAITKRPTLVRFQDEDGPAIVGLEDQVKTVPALLFFLQSTYHTRQLSDVEVLRQIEPYMLGEASGPPELDPNAGVRGLPGAPGVAWGRVIWRDTPEEIAASQACILLVREFSPDYYGLLIRCVGGVSSAGDRNSHVAVACRGRKIPAVVGADGVRINSEAHTLRIGSREFAGDIYAFVDGDSGIAWFDDKPLSRPPTIRRRFRATADAESYIEWIDTLAQSLVKRGQFKELSLPAQTHIAELRFAIRKIRAGR